MNAVPPTFEPHARCNATDRSSDHSSLGANATDMRWAALSNAGSVVATMAGLEAEQPNMQVRNFPVLIRDCPKWRRDLAENGVADLAAIMEPGIAALLAVNERGADPRPAAEGLWREFTAARGAILSLLPAHGSVHSS